MKRALKMFIYVLLALAGAAAIAIFTATQMASQKLARKVVVNPAPVAFAASPEVLPQGKYLFETRGCGDCHGADGAGRVMIDKDGFYLKAPNITASGVTAGYQEADWVRAIRHGVKPDGTPVFIMPSEDYNRLTDADLAALVAHVRALPRRPGGAAEMRLPLPVKVMYGFGLMQDAAAKIDHALPPAQPVPVAADARHGEYVAQMCKGCHGLTFSGGTIPGTPPDWPPAANLTPGAGSVLPVYDTPEKWRAMMRTGKRPDGSAVSAVMPFESLKGLNDTDLDAMHAYFKTVPAKAKGGR